MFRLATRRWRLGLGLAAVLALAAMALFRYALMQSGSRVPVEPFRIAGNLYYVGAADVTAFLLTGPDGHVVIDGGYPRNAPTIVENIATLGFDVADVQVLLNSHAHFDHAGGLAGLQEASGADLWVSEGDADIVAAGGAGLPTMWPLRFLLFTGLLRFPAPRVDHRFQDGATIRVGPIELTAHVTAGHTPGCTSWSFLVREGDRELRADIFLASHTDWFGMQRKRRESADAANPADPFIDREGYLRFIDTAEERFRNALADQQRRP